MPDVLLPTADAWRIATLELGPFLIDLLSGSPRTRRKAPPQRTLPLRRPSHLTQAVVESLCTLMNRAVYRYLWRDIGWRRRTSVDHAGRLRPNVRLWEIDPAPLRFTALSVDLLLAVFNQDSPQTWPPPVANGDLLLNYVVFRHLPKADIDQALFTSNPLCRLTAGRPAGATWDAFEQAGLLPLAPWLGFGWTHAWLTQHQSSSTLSRHAFESHQTQQGRLIRDMVDRALQPGHELILHPVMDYYTAMVQVGPLTFAQRLRHRAAEWLRWAERDAFYTRTLEAMRLALAVCDHYRSCCDQHPMERTPPQQCFMSHFQARNFAQVSVFVRALQQELRPSV